MYFQDTREPFSITLAGETMTILTLASDAAAAYKNTTSLNYDKFVQNLFNAFGVSPTTIERMYQSPEMFLEDHKSKSLLQSENPLHKCLIHLNSDIYKQQLHPGSRLDALQGKFLSYINKSLCWEKSSFWNVPSSTITKAPSSEVTVSLFQWCRGVLIDSATRTFFGDILLDISPDFTEHFFDYDENSWKLLYQYPRIFARDVHTAKSKMLDILVTYLNLSKEQKSDASWLIQTLENEQRDIGIDIRDIAAMIMMGYWV